MAELLFSYGTLQQPDVQMRIFGRLLDGSRDQLRQYRTQEIEITDPAFLHHGEKDKQLTAVPSASTEDKIDGMVYEISPGELITADQYEPSGYSRIRVVLGSGNEAWMYVSQ